MHNNRVMYAIRCKRERRRRRRRESKVLSSRCKWQSAGVVGGPEKKKRSAGLIHGPLVIIYRVHSCTAVAFSSTQ